MNNKLIFVYIFVALFPLLFIALALGIGSLIGLVSGWYSLQSRYPDQPGEPLLRLRFQSGMMGQARANLRNVLTLSVCPLGLRVGMWRLMGPFCRDFFVPWQEISVERSPTLFGPGARLTFGNPAVGSLFLSGSLIDKLARAAGDHWPEKNRAAA
jgi:hypothetical protein